MLVAWLLAPSWALSCLWGAYDANVTDQVVPTNARITLNHTPGADDAADYVLVGADGELTTVTEDRRFAWSILVPDAELVPGMGYALRQGDQEVARFYVGYEPDHEAPEPPTVVGLQQVQETSEWGTTQGLAVDVEVPEGEVVSVQYQLSEDPDFTDPRSLVSPWPSALLGEDPCSATVEGYDPEIPYFVRVRTVDLAGNRSAWTEPLQVGDIETVHGWCGTTFLGCSSIGAPASAWLALLPLLALMRGRRRQ